MKKKIYQIDAFTEKAYRGNPAGVVLEGDDLSEGQMQLIAREMNLSETAFVLRGNQKCDFEVRFFTPTSEVDLCGHATIAVFSLLKELGKLPENRKQITQKTKAGILNVKILEDNTIMMEQGRPVKSEIEVPTERLLEAMGMAENQVGIRGVVEEAEIWSTGLFDILLPVRSVEELEGLKPSMDKLGRLSEDLEVVGVHAFTIDEENQIWARNFAPAFGIDEEAATGTSNGALGACLYSKGWEGTKETFTVKQGDWMNSPSRITVQIKESAEEVEVWVGGKAVTVMTGEILVP